MSRNFLCEHFGLFCPKPEPLPPLIEPPVIVPDPDNPDQSFNKICTEVNLFRAEEGLTPLKHDASLTTMLTPHVRYMDTHKSSNHNGWIIPADHDETPRSQQMFGMGYKSGYENVGENYSAREMVRAWANSKKGHREAMLDPELTHHGAERSGMFYAWVGGKK